MKRKDGLTSEQRKEKYTEGQLRDLAEEALAYFLNNGWRRLVEEDIPKLQDGTEIRCCEWECGCFGQIEKIEMGDWNSVEHTSDWRQIFHTNHSEAIGAHDENIRENLIQITALVRDKWGVKP